MTVSEPAFEIPTVDIAPFLADRHSAAAATVVRQVRAACVTTGFLQIVGHGVSKELQADTFRAAARFFALPFADKAKLDLKTAVGNSNRGYELIGAQSLEADTLPDLKEGFYVGLDIPADDPRVERGAFLTGPNRWPAEELLPSSEFREPVERYHRSLYALCGVVLDLLALGLPYGPDIFNEFTSNDAVAALRMLHYPPQTSPDPRQLGAGAHTDFGAITLLLQDEHEGLQVWDDVGARWVPVPPNPDAYVVNVGDMLQMWTKGTYKSALHRVLNAGGADRYSLPFFFDGNLECKLTPFDGVVEGTAKVLTVEEHMRERFATTYGRGKQDGDEAT